MRKILVAAVAACGLLLTGYASAGSGVNLNSDEWLGQLKLNKDQMKKIKTAVESALDAPIDAAQQCGEARQDCEVRAAREWEFDGVKYREIVINLHRVGHASRAIGQENGKWPSIAAN